MTLVKGIANPWGEAAKGIFQIKGIKWQTVYHDPFSKEMAKWFGSKSAPAVAFNEETPVSDWKDILDLGERLNPDVSLLPDDETSRDLVLEYSRLLCGKHGLAWYSRLEQVHKGLSGADGGYPKPMAEYLAAKYGYNPDDASAYEAKVVDILSIFTQRLKEQKKAGSRFYVGNSLTAADIYSATVMGYFNPLPAEQCKMMDLIRTVLENQSEAVMAALDPILIEHRDFIYSEYLELPVQL